MSRREELNQKFEQTKSQQIIPAYYYCLHHDIDSNGSNNAIVMDPTTGHYKCKLCGRIINSNLTTDVTEDRFKTGYDYLDEFMDSIKFIVADTDEYMGDIIAFVEAMKKIRTVGDKLIDAYKDCLKNLPHMKDPAIDTEGKANPSNSFQYNPANTNNWCQSPLFRPNMFGSLFNGYGYQNYMNDYYKNMDNIQKNNMHSCPYDTNKTDKKNKKKDNEDSE